MPDTTLWCLVEGEDDTFFVTTSPTTPIAELKERIKRKKENALHGVDASNLKLWKVNVNFDGIQDAISDGQYRFKAADGERPLLGKTTVSELWPSESFSHDQLHVYIILPANMGSPTLVQMPNEPIAQPNLLQRYEEIFVKVKTWGSFEKSDLARNQIWSAQEGIVIPDFVQIFERKLVRKPRLDADTVTVSRVLGIAGSYFGASEDTIVEDEDEDESLGEPRYADESEVFHTSYVSRLYWQKAWQSGGGDKCPLKGKVADAMFFYPLNYDSPGDTTPTRRRDKDSPITFPVKRASGRPRKYTPRSDFMISHSCLPRLLVEVNSTSKNSWPMDLVRMLATGAFIVRFANHFLKPFCDEKNFVLCAIFIWDNGHVTRYSLFQQTLTNESDHAVYYNETKLLLDSSAGRIKVVRHLYSLLWLESDQDQDIRAAILELNRKIKTNVEKSMFTKDKDGNNRKKRARTDDTTDDSSRTGEGDGDDRAQLRAHGYEVKSDVIVDASGGEWATLFKRPSHILTVYRPMDSNKEFIAKKVRKDSNELEMLRLLDNFPLKSDHVISLIDSFPGWAILPKMVTVKDYVYPPNLSESKVSQICLGLIKGLAYLHEHRIAHRDIKPDNLVLNENLYLKIIDFDIAMRVEGEDEEVDDQCGTKNWMAPEVEKELRHSPIKADRWACGRVLLFLLDKFGKEDQSLKGFARNLMADNPKHRPSLLEWCNDSAPPFSNVGTVWNFSARKALRPRRDPVEVEGDGENTKPPNAKKQRLDGSQASTLCMGSENVMTGRVTAVW